MENISGCGQKNSQTGQSQPDYKPLVKRKGDNIILQRETWILVGGALIALFVFTVIFSILWGKFTLMFYWLIGALAIFLTRKTDLWKMGIEIHFPLVFMTGYAFGPLFAFSMFIIAYAGVWKMRPDEGSGVMIQTVTLSLMLGFSQITKFVYGAGINAWQFFIAFAVSLLIAQLIDGVLSKMFCPSAPMKIVILHSLDLIINIYVIRLIGFQILRYFLAMA
ncbi:MAG: hypothetical protein ABIF92_01295 [archaeon]